MAPSGLSPWQAPWMGHAVENAHLPPRSGAWLRDVTCTPGPEQTQEQAQSPRPARSWAEGKAGTGQGPPGRGGPGRWTRTGSPERIEQASMVKRTPVGHQCPGDIRAIPRARMESARMSRTPASLTVSPLQNHQYYRQPEIWGDLHRPQCQEGPLSQESAGTRGFSHAPRVHLAMVAVMTAHSPCWDRTHRVRPPRAGLKG